MAHQHGAPDLPLPANVDAPANQHHATNEHSRRTTERPGPANTSTDDYASSNCHHRADQYTEANRNAPAHHDAAADRYPDPGSPAIHKVWAWC